MSQHRRRLTRLETLRAHAPCATCRTWPALVVHLGIDPVPPAVCPVCGRSVNRVYVLVIAEDAVSRAFALS
jgi:hypothetical protein